MLSRRGARVVHGPTMATTLLGDLDATIQATRLVMSAPVDMVVFTTGIGVRSWFAAAESLGLDEELRVALSDAHVVARLRQPAQQLARLVRGDASADPQNDLRPVHHGTPRSRRFVHAHAASIRGDDPRGPRTDHRPGGRAAGPVVKSVERY